MLDPRIPGWDLSTPDLNFVDMDERTLDALTAVVTHEVGPFIKDLRNRTAALEEAHEVLKRKLYWSEVPARWSLTLQWSNDRFTQCPCVSCAFLGSGYKLGFNAGLDHEIRQARASCTFKALLKNVFDRIYAETDGSLSLIFDYSIEGPDFVVFDEDYEDVPLNSDAVYALERLEQALLHHVDE